MSRTQTNDELKAGAIIDNRYEVVSLLGSGGFANVYKARHVHLDRDVALKVLHPPLSNAAGPDALFSRRFEQEAKIAAALEHPNIVGIFDYGFLPSDEPYIAMAYLEGHDLEVELEDSQPMEPKRALRLMRGCLEGVAHGHERGVVHKDLKPSNLYLVNPGQRDERLVVLDFGIARAFNDPEARITQSGLFSGTPAYLAPEYIREQTVSPAVDVYQLGLILIEMLTGQPAVEADGPMGYLLAHCMGRLNVDPGFFDTDLGRVCKRAIAIAPEERFQNAAEFVDALEGVEAPDEVKVTAERRVPSAISQAEVEAFAQTLPETVLADTRDWSARTAEPYTTPRDPEQPRTTANLERPKNRPPVNAVPTVQMEEHRQTGSKAPVVVGALLVLAVIASVGAYLASRAGEREPVDLVPTNEAATTAAAATSATEPSMVFVLDEKPDPAREAARSVAATKLEVAVRDATRAQVAASDRAKVRKTPSRPTAPKRPRPSKPTPPEKPKPEAKPTEQVKPKPASGPTIMIGN